MEKRPKSKINKTDLVVVDSQGNFTGEYYPRKIIHSGKRVFGGIPHAVVYAIPLIGEGILETKRGPNAHYNWDAWYPATGGHVEVQDLDSIKGRESSSQRRRKAYHKAIRRELREEIGVRLNEKDIMDLDLGLMVDLGPVSRDPNKEYISIHLVHIRSSLEDITAYVESQKARGNLEIIDVRTRPSEEVIQDILGKNLFAFLDLNLKRGIASRIREYKKVIRSKAA